MAPVSTQARSTSKGQPSVNNRPVPHLQVLGTRLSRGRGSTIVESSEVPGSVGLDSNRISHSLSASYFFLLEPWFSCG